MMKSRRFADERGSIMAISALGMLSMLLAVGLCVDIGHFYAVQTELQNGADAAALAGASSLNSTASGIAAAVTKATTVMNQAEFNKQNVSVPAVNVTFAVNLGGPYVSAASASGTPGNIRFVRVATAQQDVSVFFASVVLGSTKGLSATATAGASVPTNVFCDWLPLAVLDSDVASLIPGNMYTIRGGSQSSVSPGNYQILGPAGPGGADARVGLSQGVKQCVTPGQTVATKPGVSAGDIRQGLNTRFDEYSGPVADPSVQPPDTNILEGINYTQYRAGTPSQAPIHPGSPNRRVVFLPITKISDFDQGRGTIIINRFAAFFLQTKIANGNGGDIQAEYISDRVMDGGASYDPNGGPVNNYIVAPVLYK